MDTNCLSEVLKRSYQELMDKAAAKRQDGQQEQHHYQQQDQETGKTTDESQVEVDSSGVVLKKMSDLYEAFRGEVCSFKEELIFLKQELNDQLGQLIDTHTRHMRKILVDEIRKANGSTDVLQRSKSDCLKFIREMEKSKDDQNKAMVKAVAAVTATATELVNSSGSESGMVDDGKVNKQTESFKLQTDGFLAEISVSSEDSEFCSTPSSFEEEDPSDSEESKHNEDDFYDSYTEFEGKDANGKVNDFGKENASDSESTDSEDEKLFEGISDLKMDRHTEKISWKRDEKAVYFRADDLRQKMDVFVNFVGVKKQPTVVGISKAPDSKTSDDQSRKKELHIVLHLV